MRADLPHGWRPMVCGLSPAPALCRKVYWNTAMSLGLVHGCFRAAGQSGVVTVKTTQPAQPSNNFTERVCLLISPVLLSTGSVFHLMNTLHLMNWMLSSS